MDTALHLIRSEADAATRELARYGAALEAAGESSQTPRRDLLFELLNPDLRLIEEQLSQLQESTPDRVRDAVQYGLIEVLHRIILGPGTENRRIADLSALSNTSPVGWAVANLRTAFGRVVSNAVRDSEWFVDIADEVRDQIMVAPEMPDQEELELRERVQRRSASLYGLRGAGRAREGARLFHQMFGIPEVSVPPSRQGREALRAAMNQHSQLLLLSLQEAARSPLADRAEPLRSLWVQFTPEDAEELLRRDPAVMELIVHGALLPRPRPSSKTVRQLISSVSAASRFTSWPGLTEDLVLTWLREFYADRTDHEPRPQEEPKEIPTESPDPWLQSATHAIQFPGRPLGRDVITPYDVDQKLRAAVRSLEHG